MSRQRRTIEVNQSGDPNARENLDLLRLHQHTIERLLEGWCTDTGHTHTEGVVLFGYREQVGLVLSTRDLPPEPLASAVLTRVDFLRLLRAGGPGRRTVAAGIEQAIALHPELDLVIVCGRAGVTTCLCGQSGATCAGGVA